VDAEIDYGRKAAAAGDGTESVYELCSVMVQVSRLCS
jgi:hypothetical protein